MVQRRILYALMFSAPALLAALVIAILAFGAAAGALWLFVFGDEPWPPIANVALAVVFFLVFATVSVAFLYAAYLAGKNQEGRGPLKIRHAAIAAGATALLILLIVSHQWSVGNLGAKSDGLVCSEFCQAKGYMGSGMPPRNSGASTCSCFDDSGGEAMRTPLEEILATPHP